MYLEIQDIWRPGAGLAGTQDSMVDIRDIPGNLGRVATLVCTFGNRRKILFENLHNVHSFVDGCEFADGYRISSDESAGFCLYK